MTNLSPNFQFQEPNSLQKQQFKKVLSTCDHLFGAALRDKILTNNLAGYANSSTFYKQFFPNNPWTTTHIVELPALKVVNPDIKIRANLEISHPNSDVYIGNLIDFTVIFQGREYLISKKTLREPNHKIFDNYRCKEYSIEEWHTIDITENKDLLETVNTIYNEFLGVVNPLASPPFAPVSAPLAWAITATNQPTTSSAQVAWKLPQFVSQSIRQTVDFDDVLSMRWTNGVMVHQTIKSLYYDTIKILLETAIKDRGALPILFAKVLDWRKVLSNYKLCTTDSVKKSSIDRVERKISNFINKALEEGNFISSEYDTLLDDFVYDKFMEVNLAYAKQN